MEYYRYMQSKIEDDQLYKQEKIKGILAMNDALPEQHGFITPDLLGISKKKQRASDIAKIQKEESNADFMIDVDYEDDLDDEVLEANEAFDAKKEFLELT